MQSFENEKVESGLVSNEASDFVNEQSALAVSDTEVSADKNRIDEKVFCPKCKKNKWPECFWSSYTICIPCENLRRDDPLAAVEALRREEEEIEPARLRGEIFVKRAKSVVPRRPKYIQSHEELMQVIKMSKEDGLRNALRDGYTPCLTPDEVIAQAYTGRCYITGFVYDPYDENSVKLVIDHDHETGEFRGWILARCNTMLGCARDSEEELALGIQYLQRAKQVRKMTNSHASQSLVQFGSKGGQPGEGWDPFAPKICR